ncbi:hypothetical protein [Granulicella sp. S156]|uniref:hypothetical protein n=1 Tax=Granulicella sp. S156 TaxID=1747224 RepID=UPI00131E8D6F|nr:hypothetical protein [Granulicella sp. S156]
MSNLALVAKRINNGQSEIWFDHKPNHRSIVPTNGILYPIRTICSLEESDAFREAFNDGIATIPQAATDQLAADFGLDA